jgi:hypothetical protein
MWQRVGVAVVGSGEGGVKDGGLGEVHASNEPPARRHPTSGWSQPSRAFCALHGPTRALDPSTKPRRENQPLQRANAVSWRRDEPLVLMCRAACASLMHAACICAVSRRCLHAAARREDCVSLVRGWGRAQGAVARGLASLGVEFSEEEVEPVTGYRVDMLLHGGEGGATGRCAVEVGIDFVCCVVALCCPRACRRHRCHFHNIQHRHLACIFKTCTHQ